MLFVRFHTLCDDIWYKQYPRFVGYKHSNGSSPNLVYEKYRCRSCKRYPSRDEIHSEIERQFTTNPITDEGSEAAIKALHEVWKREEGESIQSVRHVNASIKALQDSIDSQIEKLSEDRYISIHDEILKSFEKKKEQIVKLEGQRFELENIAETDKEEFYGSLMTLLRT